MYPVSSPKIRCKHVKLLCKVTYTNKSASLKSFLLNNQATEDPLSVFYQM